MATAQLLMVTPADGSKLLCTTGTDRSRDVNSMKSLQRALLGPSAVASVMLPPSVPICNVAVYSPKQVVPLNAVGTPGCGRTSVREQGKQPGVCARATDSVPSNGPHAQAGSQSTSCWGLHTIHNTPRDRLPTPTTQTQVRGELTVLNVGVLPRSECIATT